MPSLQHRVVSLVVGRLRRNLPVDDLPAMRAALTERNRLAQEGPPRRVRRGHEERVSVEHGFPVFELWRPAEGAGEAGGQPRRSVLYLHGGAYTAPTDPRHWSFLSRFADALGARAVLPAYPLAPEFTVEDSFEAVLAIFDEVAAGSPDGVVLAGDSAGGGYALAVAEALRDRALREPGAAQPTHLVLVAPWVDLTGTTPGVQEAAERDPWLSYPHLAVYASFWAGGDDPARLADPRVSPGLGSLDGLPPALMFCGTRDLIQPGCDALAARARESDWSLEYVVGPGLLHVYPLLPVPEAGPALERAVRFCRS